VAANNISNIRRWLDRLEQQAGHDDREDFGPRICVRFTAYWEREGCEGELRERALIDQAIAEVQHEARERREHLGVIHAMVVADNDGDRVALCDIPWREDDPALSWCSWIGKAMRLGRS
jgi:hypothetical protein